MLVKVGSGTGEKFFRSLPLQKIMPLYFSLFYIYFRSVFNLVSIQAPKKNDYIKTKKGLGVLF